MLNTPRLILKPLTYKQLLKYIMTDFSLETEFNLTHIPRHIPSELKEALDETIIPQVADTSKNYLFSTLWTIISKQDNAMVGDICITGEPNISGQIEIGYGTYELFRNQGYMTEAVGAIMQWAKSLEEVKSILAITEKSNIASQAILLKNQFQQFQDTELLIHWTYEIKK